MDIGKAFTFVFDDEDWITKVLVGALFVLASMVLVGIPFLIGYSIALMRNVMRGDDKPLPAWDELGEKFKEGILLVLIFLVWSIPIWIVACLQWIVTLAFANSYDSGAIISIISICVSCLSGIWGLGVGFSSRRPSTSASPRTRNSSLVSSLRSCGSSPRIISATSSSPSCWGGWPASSHSLASFSASSAGSPPRSGRLWCKRTCMRKSGWTAKMSIYSPNRWMWRNRCSVWLDE